VRTGELWQSKTQEMATEERVGSIEVVLGPMFAGKTEEMLRLVRRHTAAGRKCIVVKHTSDKRYGDDDAVYTHSGFKMAAMKTQDLTTITDSTLRGYDAVFVDEGQFFAHLETMCTHWAEHLGKVVVVSALSGTFERKGWPEVEQLCPKADKVTYITAVCADCGQDAPFSWRKTDDRSVEVVGGSEKYDAVCRACYLRRAKEVHTKKVAEAVQ
jgi:thymidine kinase